MKVMAPFMNENKNATLTNIKVRMGHWGSHFTFVGIKEDYGCDLQSCFLLFLYRFYAEIYHVVSVNCFTIKSSCTVQ